MHLLDCPENNINFKQWAEWNNAHIRNQYQTVYAAIKLFKSQSPDSEEYNEGI